MQTPQQQQQQTELRLTRVAANTTFNELGRIAHLLGDAFADSPSYAYVFKDMNSSADRAGAVAWLLHRNLWLQVSQQVAWVVRFRDLPEHLQEGVELDPDEPVCFFMCVPRADQPLVTMWQMVRAGLLSVPVRFGVPALMRFFQCRDEFNEMEDRVWAPGMAGNLDGRRVFLLHVMCVHPLLKRRGIGTASVKALLQQLCAQPAGGPGKLVLVTQEKGNVDFYARLGFTMVKEYDTFVPKTKDVAFHSWMMELDFEMGPPATATPAVA